MASAVVTLSACGGGDGSVAPAVDPNARVLAPGSYKLAFPAISTARLEAPISGIDVSVKFPAGISVSTVTGASGEITAASITSGNAVQWSPFGSYSTSTRRVYLNMITAQSSYRGGQYLNLPFTVGAGTAITPNDIFVLNTGYSPYKVVGFDTTCNIQNAFFCRNDFVNVAGQTKSLANLCQRLLRFCSFSCFCTPVPPDFPINNIMESITLWPWKNVSPISPYNTSDPNRRTGNHGFYRYGSF